MKTGMAAEETQLPLLPPPPTLSTAPATHEPLVAPAPEATTDSYTSSNSISNANTDAGSGDLASEADSLTSPQTQARCEDSTMATCYCALSGQVDDCACTIERVNEVNTRHMHALLREIVQRPFFHFFRVNLERPCPFWRDDAGKCASKNCVVQSCGPEDMPQPLSTDHAANKVWNGACMGLRGQEEQEGVNLSLSDDERRELADWASYDEETDPTRFCVPDDAFVSNTSIFVNLLRNPERYTGFSGDPAHHIWDAIYKENCFRVDSGGSGTTSSSSSSSESASSSSAATSFWQELRVRCLEERVFHRIVSGMHASISCHLTHQWLHADTGEWYANLHEFDRRFSLNTTKGNGAVWLKNLYFTYLTVLRAVAKAAPIWERYPFYTGSEADDRATQALVRQVARVEGLCGELFDEESMFRGANADEMQRQFRDHFRNITRIMDCVGCTKCRLWGKLQVRGLGTALKILFSERFNRLPTLTRNEVVALFNTLERLSSSIEYIQEFQHMKNALDRHGVQPYVPSGSIDSAIPDWIREAF